MVNAKALKAKMREMNITQKDIANRLGCKAPTVSQKINGVRPLYLDEAWEIALMLKIEAASFCSYFFSKDVA